MKSNPYKVIILFFIISILLGTVLLSLPFMCTKKISFIDRVFTSASAVCVTGLATIDISSCYSFWGQLVILSLIQIGGLGYMLFGSLIIILFGKLNLVQKRVIGESLNVNDITNVSQIVSLMKSVVFFTICFETFGSVILFIKFYFVENYSLFISFWYAIFHSISAFCNAGFSLFSNSFENFYRDPIINITIPILIISGGLGFIVWMDIIKKIRAKKENFLLHSKIVFFMTIFLLSFGFITIFFLNRKMFISHNIPFKTQIFISWFQSVTSRTAGFNTFPINNLSSLTIIIIMCLMFIGASPGGTGGGIKTTTFFVIVRSIYNYIIGEKDVYAFKRRIDINIILKSFSIFFVCLFFVFVISSFVHLSSGFSYKECLFETISAFGTVGLSLGITSSIDNLSKILLIITMFVGRIGSISLVSFLFAKEPKEIKYLEESISIG